MKLPTMLDDQPSMIMLALYCIITAVIILIGIVTSDAAGASEKVQQSPTATELWQLRSACVELREKLVKDLQSHETGMDRILSDTSSRYDPVTGHCYIATTAMEKTGDERGAEHHVLWDGQTGKILASIDFPIHREPSGSVSDPQHVGPSPDKFDDQKTFWRAQAYDAVIYIHRLMSEDRERCQ
jgi:hypothetical protein